MQELDQMIADTLPPEGCWLRELQEKIAEELELDATTVSRQMRRLKKADVIAYERKGRSYWVTRGPSFDDWEPTVWETPTSLALGTKTGAVTTTEDLEHAWLVWGRNVSKNEFRNLLQAYKRGDMEQVFIPAGATAFAYKTAEGETVKVKRDVS